MKLNMERYSLNQIKGIKRTATHFSEHYSYFLKLLFIYLCIELQLIYNTVLVSGVQQSDSVIHTHTYMYMYVYIYIYIYIYIFKGYFPLQVLRDIVQFPVVYSKSLLVIYFIYSCMYLLIPTPNLSLPLLFPLVTVNLFSMSMGLFLFCK